MRGKSECFSAVLVDLVSGQIVEVSGPHDGVRGVVSALHHSTGALGVWSSEGFHKMLAFDQLVHCADLLHMYSV